MPSSNNSIKFFYGDSSTKYPPQSINNNALYLIKNTGVYAGSNTIIDKTLFPINEDNTYFVTFSATLSGSNVTVTCDKSYSDILTAWSAKKLILGKIASSGTNQASAIWYGADGILSESNPNFLSCQWMPDFKGNPYFLFSNAYQAPNGDSYLMSISVANTDECIPQFAKLSRDGHTHSNYLLTTSFNKALSSQGIGIYSSISGTTIYITLSNFSLYNGGMVTVWFSTDVPAGASLNINSTGSKAIKIRTTSSTAAAITAGMIKAGDTATFIYDGTNYQLINVNSNNERLRYKLIGTTNITSSAGLTNMEPGYVYVVGAGAAGTIPSWSAISTMKIGTLKTTGYGVPDINGSSVDSCPVDNTLVPIYQIMFKASSSFSSIGIPSTTKWKDNLAPDPRDIRGNYCELTIMNNIATMNIVS